MKFSYRNKRLYFPGGPLATPPDFSTMKPVGNLDKLYDRRTNIDVTTEVPESSGGMSAGSIASGAAAAGGAVVGAITQGLASIKDVKDRGKQARQNAVNSQMGLQQTGDSYDALMNDASNMANLTHTTWKNFLDPGSGAMNVLSSTMSGAGAGASFGPIGAAVGAGINGLLPGIFAIKAKKRAKKESGLTNSVIDYTNDFNDRMLGMRTDNISDNYYLNQMGNLTAYGGPINRFDDGGNLHTNGTTWDTGVIDINNGGTHEENPYDGVQIGVDEQGTPNLVEEGEVIYNDYVYSNRMIVPDDIKKTIGIKGKKDVTYADAAKKIEEQLNDRPNDPITQRGVDAQMQLLAESQEQAREEQQQQEQAQQEYMQQMYGNPQEQVSPEEEQYNISSAEPIFAYGGELGNMYDGNGIFPNIIAIANDVKSKTSKVKKTISNVVNKAKPYTQKIKDNAADIVLFPAKVASKAMTVPVEELKKDPVKFNKTFANSGPAYQGLPFAIPVEDYTSNLKEFNTIPGKFGGAKNSFNGSGSGGKFNIVPDNIKNFNDAYDHAVGQGWDTFWFNNRLYNTDKENNPIREWNNRAVGKNRKVGDNMSPYYDHHPYMIGDIVLNDILSDKESRNFGYNEDLYNMSKSLKKKLNERSNSKAQGGNIHIAPSKRGTFTAAATKHGKGVQESASQVLGNPDNYSPAMVKKANFARNAAKWHAEGGLLGKKYYGWGDTPNFLYSPDPQRAMEANGLRWDFNNMHGQYPKANDPSRYIPYRRDSLAEATAIRKTPEFNYFTNYVINNRNNPQVQDYLRDISYADENNEPINISNDEYIRLRTTGPWGYYTDTPRIVSTNNIKDDESLIIRYLSENDIKNHPLITKYNELFGKLNYPSVSLQTPGPIPLTTNDQVSPVDKGSKGKKEKKSKAEDETFNPYRNNWAGWLRYVPALGAGIGLATALKKPDYGNADMAMNAVNSVGQMIPEFVGDYMRYIPVDVMRQTNAINANAAASRRNVLNTSAGNLGTAMAGNLANDYNTQRAIGEALIKDEQTNWERYKNEREYNRETNKFNATAKNEAERTNAVLRTQRANAIFNIAKMRQGIEDSRSAAIQANLTNLFNNIGAIGEDYMNRRDKDWMIATGMYGMPAFKPYGWTNKQWEALKKENEKKQKERYDRIEKEAIERYKKEHDLKSNGGKLKRK